MATRIHGNGNERASMFYEAAFGIAILVPFTAISTDTARGAKESNNGSAKERSFEATFLEHRVGNGHKIVEPVETELGTPSIEFLILEQQDGWDRLYIGSVSNRLPQGVGCTMFVKMDPPSVGKTRELFGTWDKGVCLGWKGI